MKRIILFSAMLFIAGTTARADDDAGAISLNMFNANYGNTYLASWICVDAQNNFTGASFVPVQETDSVTVIPATGWTNKMAAEPGTLLIAYLKGVYYQIYVNDYIVHSEEVEKTTGDWFSYSTTSKHWRGNEPRQSAGDWFSYSTTVKRSTEILGVRINYRQLTDVKIAQDVSVNSKNPRIFVGYMENNVFTNKIKTALTKIGCVLTTNAPQSDFQLYVEANQRQFNSDRDFVYCYLDVTLELFNTSAGESIYVDDFSQKGVSTSRDRAVRVAIDDAVEAVGEKIMPLIIKNKEQ